MMLAKLGNLPAMSAHFVKLRRDNPQSAVPLYISEAEILREEGRGEAAFNLLSGALDQNPNDEDLLYSRSLAAESIDRLEVAERDLRTLIEADPENGQALNALGYTLADRTDRYQEALDYLQRALALLPDDAAVLDSMGWVLYRLGRYEESLNYLRRAYEASADEEIAAHLREV
jgi:tetratricopeptide (TPR) repeat protein